MPRKCKNWLEAYLEYTSEQESPIEFHRWTGIAVLSATLGRHIYMDRGYYTIYPNIYVVLVAGSAKCRKSVSSHIGVDFINELKQRPMVFSQKITNEALIKALLDAKIDGQSCGLIYASELSVFMGKDAIGSGLIPTLTDLYDSPRKWSYHTRTRGIEILENVSLCMLGASTMDWLRTAIPADAVGGGFTSRIIFIYQDKIGRSMLFPRKKAHFEQLKKDMIEDLNHIRTQRGPMDLTPEAMAMAEKWYNDEMSKVHDARLEGYFGRKHDTMFKIAMCLSLASTDDRWVTAEHIDKALTLLKDNEASLGHIMATVTATEIGEKTGKILAIINKHEKLTHTELLKACWRVGPAIEIAEHIKTLIEAGEISQHLENDNRTRYYKTAKAWKVDFPPKAKPEEMNGKPGVEPIAPF